jgi:hypothetical protein
MSINKSLNISPHDILSLIPKSTPSFPLIVSLLCTDTTLYEILSCNPIIISTLIDNIPSTLSLLHDMISKDVYFTAEHKRSLRRIFIKNKSVSDYYLVKMSLYICEDDLIFIENVLDRVDKNEKFSVVGMEIISKNVSMNPSLISYLIKRKHSLLVDVLEFILDTHTDIIYSYRYSIYELVRDTSFYIKMSKYEIFMDDLYLIIDRVDNKEELLLNIDISIFSKISDTKNIIDIIKKYNITNSYVLLRIFKMSKDKKNIIDYVYSVKNKVRLKLLLTLIYYQMRRGILEGYKYKERYLCIVRKKIYRNENKGKFSKINQSIKNESDTTYKEIDRGNLLLREYFMYGTKEGILDFLDKNISDALLNKYILQFIRYTRYEYSEYLLRCKNINKEDIVNEDIAKRVINNIEEYTERYYDMILYCINKKYDVYKEVSKLINRNNKYFDILKYINKDTIIRRYTPNSNITLKRIFSEIFTVDSMDKNVDLYILNIMKEEGPSDFLIDIMNRYVSATEYLSYYIDICIKYKRPLYGIMKYVRSKKEYRRVLRMMYCNINDARLLNEYIRDIREEDEDYYRVLFKNIKKNLKICYQVLIKKGEEDIPISRFNKIVNITKNILRRVKYKMDYEDVYCVLEILIEYKNEDVFKRVVRDIIECIGLDERLNEYIREVLLIYIT